MTLLMEGIALDDPLRLVIQDKVTAMLGRGRLRPRVTRVAFSDENGPKGGVSIRCLVTVELPRRPALHASDMAETPRQAFDGTIEALEREVSRDRQRRRDAARRPKKYFVAHRGLQPDGAAELPPPRRRRRRRA
jgi:ribosome-associated translation inhibitor RaiA